MPKWLLDLINWVFQRPAPAPVPTPRPSPGITSAAVVAALNAQRANDRLPSLTQDGRLDASALAWAKDMAASRMLWHGDFANRMVHAIPGAAAAEDIAEGQQTVRDVVTGWMNSPPHRANILGDYNLVGVGFATAKDGAMYWCVDFAKV